MNTKQGILFIEIAFLIFCAFVGTVSAADIYAPDNYTKIQWAVDNATEGDTIIVRDGTYTENIDVDKSHLTIQSENGSDSTIVQSAGGDIVFDVTADYVNISGFTVKGATDAGGIHLQNVTYCNISNNTLLDNGYGVRLHSSSSNTITGNAVLNNWWGINPYLSTNNTIASNTVSNNYGGIYVGGSNDNTIINNTASSNDGPGIWLARSYNNTITNNSALSNEWGILLGDSSNNIIYLNNLIDNVDSVVSSFDSTNIWNSTEKITYTYNDTTYTNYLGNYWDDYVFAGNDTNKDGIGDTPYSINSDNDNYPLMERFENYFAPTLPPTTPDYFSEDWVEKVINWASKQEGKDFWKEYCMAFVSDAFKVCENRPASANALRNDFENAGKFYSKENNWDPPRGSLVFFSGTGKYASYGHIGISLGDRKVIHAYQTVREETITDIEGLSYIDSYLGWAYPPEEWFSPKISNTFKKGDIVYKKEGWNLRDIPSLHGKILSTAGGNGEIIEDEWNGICNAGYYWWHITFGDYEGWCAEEGLDQPPVCAIELRKEGVGINEIDVGEFFDIYVGDSTDDTGIREVRFSSDDSQDGNPTGEWTEWYDWDTSSGDWNAETKIKKWSFATDGAKEVWAEVKDDAGQTDNHSANIYAIFHEIVFRPPYKLSSTWGWEESHLLGRASNYSEVDPTMGNGRIIARATATYGGDGKALAEFTLGDSWKSDRSGTANIIATFNTSGPIIWNSISFPPPLPPGKVYLGVTLKASLSVYDHSSSTEIWRKDLNIYDHEPEWKIISVPDADSVRYRDTQYVIQGFIDLQKDHTYTWSLEERIWTWVIVAGAATAVAGGNIETELIDVRIEPPILRPEPEPVTFVEKFMYVVIGSPADVLLIDPEDRRIGFDFATQQEVNEIPEAWYSGYEIYPQLIEIPAFIAGNYKVLVSGTSAGSYTLAVIIGDLTNGGVTELEILTFTATDIPTAPGAVHQYTIDWTSLSHGEEEVTVQVDSDGDGVFEDTFTADGELTYDEFMLQTVTTIDFDPDTLNLQSKGKWVTTYIELPEGCDVSAINVSTVMLNDHVQAEMKPTEIGDYDDDGIVELMVKFDWSAVQEILEVGDEVEITVTGGLTDGTPFEGSDVIRVIDKG